MRSTWLAAALSAGFAVAGCGSDDAQHGGGAQDMSVPDMRHYARAGLPFFTRHSDLEPTPALYEQAAGVWLDDFDGGFVAQARIATHLAAGKRVAVVSPELHGREREGTWREWSAWSLWARPDVYLCTDHPTSAQEVFA